MQKFLVRIILALPSSWLVALSGGRPTVIEERRLDARLQFLGAMAKRQPSLATLTPQAAREAAAQGFKLLDGDADPHIDTGEFSIPGPDGRMLRIRSYKPRLPNRYVPVLIYFHMGGFVIGDLETCHVLCSTFAARAECLVLSVDYRLAPEDKYPAQCEDALAAFRWARVHAHDLGGNPAMIAVGGDSAGGGLAAMVAQELRRTGEKPPSLQLLIYPAVDWASEAPSMKTFGDAYPLTTEIMNYFRGHYFHTPEEALGSRASPARAEDLAGLPPALIYTAGFDPLVDQGRDYAEALKVAGVQVLYRCFDSLTHAFTAMSGTIPRAKAAIHEIAEDLRRAIG
ncbi:MAG: alpha/beta hydrolase fold domain-containing protein [Alphaproteobacteria bacterium]|nr:alpha/beta hydrolase fold domain-containing protein [Alphaproteobacteria bacterium]